MFRRILISSSSRIALRKPTHSTVVDVSLTTRLLYACRDQGRLYCRKQVEGYRACMPSSQGINRNSQLVDMWKVLRLEKNISYSNTIQLAIEKVYLRCILTCKYCLYLLYTLRYPLVVYFDPFIQRLRRGRYSIRKFPEGRGTPRPPLSIFTC